MRISVTTADAAWQFLAAGRFADASELARAILKREPDNVAALACAAMAEWELGRPVEDAIAMLKRALDLAPRNGALWHNLATLEAASGRIDSACTAFGTALDINPSDTRAFFGLAQNRRAGHDDRHLHDMLALYASGTLSRADLEFLCFGLAKIYADLGNASRAMHFCIEANWVAGRTWDGQGERMRLNTIRSMAEGGAFSRGRNSPPGPVPVFIVGMPRSGTTLVEAMLARHPNVHALGETTHIFALDRDLTGHDPGKIPGLDRDRARAAAEATLRSMRREGTAQTRIVTDKTPENAFRIGLIARLFPTARIIHVRRNPLDCGLSNLMTRFTHGQGFSFRQAELGERIRQTAEVMSIWRRLGLLPILDVSYELLVADPEAQARRMTDFLDLDWDAACLSPEQAQRHVKTASQFQVRQKIHSSSVGRHLPYREWLGPLIEALGGDDWIDAELADQMRAGVAS